MWHSVMWTPSTLFPPFDIFSQSHLGARFENLRKHCIRDLTDKQKPITVFLKESFMEEVPEEDEAFYTQFFETQTWMHYVDNVLRSADKC